ncbi:hypothetical protein, partial [Salmonella enterica]|uniref:hypothetical protein n=1 Tax=Salmonella enterica TaxID=28901 RepID=UPI001CB6CBBA
AREGELLSISYFYIDSVKENFHFTPLRPHRHLYHAKQVREKENEKIVMTEKVVTITGTIPISYSFN